MHDRFYVRYGKRWFDSVVSFIGLLLFSPILGGIAIGIKVSSPGPILFSQERMGLGFRRFRLYKFRSMVVDAAMKGPAVTSGNDARITSIGRFLRRTKLDELPQLWNVLIGDMSFVGPRPEVEQYVTPYQDAYHHILSVRPGITDEAAIVFRNEEEILQSYDNVEEAYLHHVLPQKIALYHQYIYDVRFFSDIVLILKTFNRIAKK